MSQEILDLVKLDLSKKLIASHYSMVKDLEIEKISSKSVSLVSSDVRAISFLQKKYHAIIEEVFAKKLNLENFNLELKVKIQKIDYTKPKSNPFHNPNAPILVLKNIIWGDYEIIRDMFTRQVCMKKKGEAEFKVITEQNFNDLILDLHSRTDIKNLNIGDVNLLINSSHAKDFNSIKDVFEQNRNSYDRTRDGDLFEKMCQFVKISNDFSFSKVFKKWLLRSLYTAINPNSKFVNEHLFVLQGGEGLRKSTFINNLFPDWLLHLVENDKVDDPKSTEFVKKVSTKLFWFIDEWDEQPTYIQKQLKSVLSYIGGSRRTAYAQFETEFKRIVNYLTACNATNFLWSEKGNRRYIIATVTHLIDTNKTDRINKTKLWSQLYQELCELKLSDLHWTNDELETFKQNNYQYNIDSSEKDIILRYFSVLKLEDFDVKNPSHTRASATTIFEFLCEKHPKINFNSVNSVGMHLQHLGFIRKDFKQKDMRKAFFLELNNVNDQNFFSTTSTTSTTKNAKLQGETK